MDNKRARSHEAEYVEAHFRISCDYNGIQGWTSEESMHAFKQEAASMFEDAGWSIEKGRSSGISDAVHREKESLYLHPQDFSGVIRKDSIPELIMLLRGGKSFVYEGVDLYDDFFIISDCEYLSMLKARGKDIEEEILLLCTTRRRNLFVPSSSVFEKLEKKFRLHRVGEKYGDPILTEYILELIQRLVMESKLVQANIRSGIGLRTAKKSE